MRYVSILLLFSSILTSCGDSKNEPEQTSESQTSIELKYAQNFKLERSDESFILTILDPDSKESVASFTLSDKEDKRFICLTATLTGMFCELDARDYLIGMTARNQLHDGILKLKAAKGDLKEFGDFTQLSLERIADASPDVILYNYVNQEFPNQEKLKRLGIKVVLVNDWLEAHPLAKAEWIKVVGAMTGKFNEACEIFEKIESRYLELSEQAKELKNKPTVLSGNLIGDRWYTPSGENYFGILIADAGGNYVYKESTGPKSLALPLEQILEDNKETQIWINPGVPTKKQLLQINPHADLLLPAENNIYCYSDQNNKFWEESATRPDLVLEDLIHIFHPTFGSGYDFHFYAPLAK